MPRLLIIADDLTGALDTGVKFSEAGLSTMVSTRWQDAPIFLSCASGPPPLMPINSICSTRRLWVERSYLWAILLIRTVLVWVK